MADYDFGDRQRHYDANSRLSKQCNSDRKHIKGGANSSGDDNGTDEEQVSDDEFKKKRKNIRNKANKRGQSTRNQKDRVSTAHQANRRTAGAAANQNTKSNSRLFGNKERFQVNDGGSHERQSSMDGMIPPAMKNTDSKIDLLFERLK